MNLTTVCPMEEESTKKPEIWLHLTLCTWKAALSLLQCQLCSFGTYHISKDIRITFIPKTDTSLVILE